MDNPLVFTLAFSIAAIIVAIPVGLYNERKGVYLLMAGIILFCAFLVIAMAIIIATAGDAR